MPSVTVSAVITLPSSIQTPAAPPKGDILPTRQELETLREIADPSNIAKNPRTQKAWQGLGDSATCRTTLNPRLQRAQSLCGDFHGLRDVIIRVGE